MASNANNTLSTKRKQSETSLSEATEATKRMRATDNGGDIIVQPSIANPPSIATLASHLIILQKQQIRTELTTIASIEIVLDTTINEYAEKMTHESNNTELTKHAFTYTNIFVDYCK